MQSVLPMRALDQESVGRREYLAIRPNGTQRLDDGHQVIQGFEWIAARNHIHVNVSVRDTLFETTRSHLGNYR